MNKRKQFIELEKSLEQKYKNENESLVSLGKEDFKDGKLSFFGYHRLKQQCEHISMREEIEIAVPQEYADIFKGSLEHMAAGELSAIKSEKRGTLIKALILLSGGIFFILLGFLLELFNVSMVKEIIIVASWVFVWAAVEKMFFDRTALVRKRFKLLQILSARITAQ